MRRTTGILILALLAGLLWTSRSRPDEAAVADPSPPADDSTAPAPTVPGIRVVTLDEVECADAGYLCSDLPRTGEFRAIRWPDEVERLRIRVPLPSGVDPATARELQRQAAAGIREWQGRPLALQVETTDRDGPADVRVRWVESMDGDRIGQASVRWRVGPGGAEFGVDDFVLAVRAPDGGTVPPDRIRLTAAHEMGHVLGLPHSPDPADVMYAYNTATRLTFRDFRTVERLYGLPAGVRIVPAPDR